MDRPYGISDFAFPTRWDRESGPDVVERAGRGSDRAGGQAQPGRETGRDSIRSRSGFDRSRTIYRGRHRDYSLRESEVRTLTDIGKFRVVPADDLARFGITATAHKWRVTFVISQGKASSTNEPSKGIRPFRPES